MTESEEKCPDGWVPSQLVAYVDGDLDSDTCRQLESHLATCAVCAAEIVSIERLGDLLRSHPESFHPDAEDLAGYLKRGADPDGRIALHLTDCEQCNEDLELLQEMFRMESQPQARTQGMPRSLLRHLEELHGSVEYAKPSRSMVSLLVDSFRMIFRAPVLALGSAAAVIVAAIFWTQFWDVHQDILLNAEKPALESPRVAGLAPPPPVKEPVESSRSKAKGTEELQRLQKSEPLDAASRKSNRGAAETAPLPGPSHDRPAAKVGEGSAGRPSGDKGYGPSRRVPHWGATPGGLPEGVMSGKPAPSSQAQPPALPRAVAPEGALTPSAEPQSQPEARSVPRKKQPRQAYRKLDVRSPQTLSESEQAAPATGSVASSLRDRRVPVRVIIEDSAGRGLAGVHIVLPAHLQNRFKLVHQGMEEYRIEPHAGAEKLKASPEIKDEDEARRLISVRVSQSEKGFDVEATLVRDSTGPQEKTIGASGVSREHLDNEIGFLVGTLLEKE